MLTNNLDMAGPLVLKLKVLMNINEGSEGFSSVPRVD